MERKRRATKITIKYVSYRLDWACFLIFPIILLTKSLLPESYSHMIERGKHSLLFLQIIIFMKPALVIIGHPWKYKILHFRRHLGIIAFWFAFFHVGGIIIFKGWRNINHYLGWDNYLFWGAIAAIFMMLLGITTNYYSVKKLGKRRKNLQYLTYPTLFLTMAHQAMVPFIITTKGYTKLYQGGYVLLLFLILKYIEWLIEKRKVSSRWKRIKK